MGRGPRFRGRPKPCLAAGWLGGAPPTTAHTSARGAISAPSPESCPSRASSSSVTQAQGGRLQADDVAAQQGALLALAAGAAAGAAPPALRVRGGGAAPHRTRPGHARGPHRGWRLEGHLGARPSPPSPPSPPLPPSRPSSTPSSPSRLLPPVAAPAARHLSCCPATLAPLAPASLLGAAGAAHVHAACALPGRGRPGAPSWRAHSPCPCLVSLQAGDYFVAFSATREVTIEIMGLTRHSSFGGAWSALGPKLLPAKLGLKTAQHADEYFAQRFPRADLAMGVVAFQLQARRAAPTPAPCPPPRRPAAPAAPATPATLAAAGDLLRGHRRRPAPGRRGGWLLLLCRRMRAAALGLAAAARERHEQLGLRQGQGEGAARADRGRIRQRQGQAALPTPGQGPREPRARQWQGAGGQGAGARVGLTAGGMGRQAGARRGLLPSARLRARALRLRLPPSHHGTRWGRWAAGGWCAAWHIGLRVVYEGHS